MGDDGGFAGSEPAAAFHARWDGRIPGMTCAGCPDCCGPVLAREEEWRAVRAWAEARGVAPRRPAEDGPDPRCGFLGEDGRCRIYPVRPLICRLYGAAPASVPNCRCPRAAGAPSMGGAEHAEMMAEYPSLGSLMAYDAAERAAFGRWCGGPTSAGAFIA